MATRLRVLAAAVVAAVLTAVMAQPAFAGADVDITGSYTYGVSGVTPGDNAPTISLSGGLTNTDYFYVDNLKKGGAAGDATTGGGLLFTVDPASCITSKCGSGTEHATISVDFTFYSGGKAIGTVSDTALATFDYTGGDNGTDNLCWNGTVTDTKNILVSSAPVGTCGLPGAPTQTAFEQIEVDLGGQYYDVDLHDWNDWDETPQITFTAVPEPASLALLGGGLLGLGGLVVVRRRRKAAAKPLEVGANGFACWLIASPI